jgi:hypothetical protein
MRPSLKLTSSFGILAFLTLLIYPFNTEADRPEPPTMTPPQVFTATVSVMPSATIVELGETLDVIVSVKTSQGCSFPIYEMTLSQDVPLFDYVSPPTPQVGPPVSNPFTYTLSAVSTGTVTFGALLYGERYCGDFWVWTYLSGGSGPVAVALEKHWIYLPLILRD